MTIFDAHNRFDYKRDVSGEVTSENIIDFGVERDLAIGTNLEVAAIPSNVSGKNFTGTGTLKVTLETAEDEAFTDPIVLGESGDLTVKQLNEGGVGMKLSYGGKRYMRMKYAVTGTITGLMITSGIVIAHSHVIHYPHRMHS